MSEYFESLGSSEKARDVAKLEFVGLMLEDDPWIKRKAKRLHTNDGDLLYKKKDGIMVASYVTLYYYIMYCMCKMPDFLGEQLVECTKFKKSGTTFTV